MPWSLRGVTAAALALLCAAGFGQRSAAQSLSSEADGVYLSAGLGLLSLDQGAGFNIPLGFTVVSSRLRLIATVNLLDAGILQESNTSTRYVRFIDSVGRSVCVDTEFNRAVSSFNCSGSSDLLRSASADVGFVPIETDFFAGKAGKVFIGAGFRQRQPQTFYGTLGMIFPTASRTAGGFKVQVGSDFVFVGVTWSMDLRRIFGRF